MTSLINRKISLILTIFISFWVILAPTDLYGDLSHFPEPHHSSVNMSILVMKITGIEIVDGSELAVKTPSGIIAGAVEITVDDTTWGIAAWADDETTPEDDGFHTGDTISFILWDPYRAVEIPAEITRIIRGGSPTFIGNGLLVVELHVDAPEIPPKPPEWIDVPEEVEGEEGSLIEFEIRGKDPNHDSLTISYSSDNLPSSATFTDNGNGTGLFRWQTSFYDVGAYTAVFRLSDGIFEVSDTVGITILDRPATSDFYVLDGPFPNPFNGRARLKFSVPDNRRYTIEAFDCMGRRVDMLGEGADQGEYYAYIDGNELSSGIYIFILDSGNFRKYIKGVVLR